MAEKIPLNLYKRITTPLLRIPEVVYTAPSDRASVILNTFTNNNTNDNRFVTIALLNQTQDNVTFLNRFPLGQRDVVNLTPQKIILGEQDQIIASADIEDVTNFEDSATFWEFNLPTDIISLDGFSVGFTTGASVTADFGASNLQTLERTFNSNFDDWSGWTTQTFAVSGGVLGTGPTGWRQGLNIGTTPPASGTFQLFRINSTTEDLQYFSNQYYSRVQLNNVSFSGDFVNNPRLNARGVLAATGSGGPNTLSLNPVLSGLAQGEAIFGKTAKIIAWVKASSATKIVVDAPSWFRDVPGGILPVYEIKDRFTIFNVTTAWQKIETTFLIPGSAEWVQEAFDRNLIDTNDPNWGTPAFVWPLVSDTTGLTSFEMQIRFNFFRGPWTLLQDGYKNSWTIAASANSSLITNGYYDIGGVEIYIGSKNTFTPLSSFVPVNFTYDLSNETDTNVTLSILEAVNTQ